MIEVHPVTPDRWEDMVELFEQRGPRGGYRNTPAYGCWCMWWRDRALEHGEGKKRGMEELVRKGRRPGLLAYEDGSPVGWISIAAREEYAQLKADLLPGWDETKIATTQASPSATIQRLAILTRVSLSAPDAGEATR